MISKWLSAFSNQLSEKDAYYIHRVGVPMTENLYWADSILVRLKAFRTWSGRTRLRMCFDSKMVRLKAATSTPMTYSLWFRFHTGSIKSLPVHFSMSSAFWFRFQNGSIKSLLQNPLKIRMLRFDSILVRLKVETSRLEILPAKIKVSIPYWFD